MPDGFAIRTECGLRRCRGEDLADGVGHVASYVGCRVDANLTAKKVAAPLAFPAATDCAPFGCFRALLR